MGAVPALGGIWEIAYCHYCCHVGKAGPSSPARSGRGAGVPGCRLVRAAAPDGARSAGSGITAPETATETGVGRCPPKEPGTLSEPRRRAVWGLNGAMRLRSREQLAAGGRRPDETDAASRSRAQSSHMTPDMG